MDNKQDVWTCNKCGQSGVVKLTGTSVYKPQLVECPNGHKWYELMSVLLRAA